MGNTTTEDDLNGTSISATSSARSLQFHNTVIFSRLRNRRLGYTQLGDDLGGIPALTQPDTPPSVETVTEALDDHTLGSDADSNSGYETANEDPAAAPEAGSEGDTAVPAFYCRECGDARRDEGYTLRLFDLTTPLECHACNAKHRAVHFTARERAATASRTCIARQGSRVLCPHWEVDLDDIRDWQRYLHEDIPETATNIELCWGTLFVKCPDPSHQDDAEASRRCPFANVRLYLWEHGVELLFVEARWEFTPGSSSQGETGFEACKRTIGQLHRHCPEAFGPAPLSPYHIRSLAPEDLHANTAGLKLTAKSRIYFNNLNGPIGDLDSKVGQGFFEICGAPRLAYADTLTLPRSAGGDLTDSYLWSAFLNPVS
ncbi:uncharacterized protein F5Z01DRAFT_108727 [Emericellopsis atlantica]|uniref:Uncharacterized protein n=1 Tax=Emericellopsis atlantica TaxID=2614577 RepID=A0A9P7ZLV7_9HYPO|nr:uncharacterized protein F5Z01DRAFT_108727 [Emericellopsis atlantica]KAG9254509.1 hypothetical protein F5Z01DRAFT_108727 [Emericellopsis atlantica]